MKSSTQHTLLVLTNLWIISAVALPNELKPLDGKIIGGHEAEPYSHPYMVSLQIRFLGLRAHICGGSILNKNWVLTAAHCVTGSWLIRWLGMDAIAGAHNVNRFGPNAQIRSVSQRIEHPFYEGKIGPHDIAVLKVTTPFTFTDKVQPINLPQDNFKFNNIQALSLSGWGALKTTFFFPDLPDRLQEVDVTYVPYDDCYAAIDELSDVGETNPLDEDSNICTGPVTGGIAACSGDSGGPLVYYLNKKYKNGKVANKEYVVSKKISNATLSPPSDIPVAVIYDTTETINEHSTTTVSTTISSTLVQSSTENEGSAIMTSTENEIENDQEGAEEVEEKVVPIVLGVVSWGVSPCGEKGAPTVYTKVSNYIDFINSYINS